jgi:filamentous hemagglutinin family protein
MPKKHWTNLTGLQLLLVGGQIALLFANQSFAQNITLDGTLGPAKVLQGPKYEIFQNYGTTVGTNLFHSFKQFNVEKNQEARIKSSDNINNIFSRVTGGSPSTINGILRAENDAVNLFFINPNGIIFGKDARLDVGGTARGSFVATTLDSLVWADGSKFSAINPGDSNSLLKISGDPSGFLSSLENKPKAIKVEGTNLTNTSFSSDGNPPYKGQSLLLIGGDVNFEKGNLAVPGGRVEMGGLAEPGTVELKVDGNIISLSFPENIQKGDVSLADGSIVDVRSNGGGSIAVNARNLDMSGGSQFFAGIESGNTSPESKSGNIQISATGNIKLNDRSIIANNLGKLFGSTKGTSGDVIINAGSLSVTGGSVLQASTYGTGDAGSINIKVKGLAFFEGEVADFGSVNELYGSGVYNRIEPSAQGKTGGINITTDSLEVKNGAVVSTSTDGKGKDGQGTVASNISITVDKNALFDGVGRFNSKLKDFSNISSSEGARQSSGVYSSLKAGSEGRSGDITIKARNLTVSNGATFYTSTRGRGNAGNITVDVSSQALFSGEQQESSGEKFFNSSVLSEVEKDGNTIATGDGGDINITAGSLVVEKGASISTSTLGRGDAGKIVVKDTNQINISGVGKDSQPSGIFSQVGTEADGKGGSIEIKTQNFHLTNNGQISAQSQGTGDAGNINVNSANNFNANNGSVITQSEQAGGGNISVTTKDMRLRNDSDIRTNSGGSDGGNITLKSDTIIALEDSDILAFAPKGKGGDISFNTRAFFSNPLYRPTIPITDAETLDSLDGNNRVDVDASGIVSGNIVGIPDISFIQDSLTDLPDNRIDTDALIANSCISRASNRNGTFSIIGKGGIPLRPGDASLPNHSTGKIQSLPTNTQRPWKIGDPIVEPTGIYQLPNGQNILIRECSK